jgi:hypothetical protein
MQRANSSIVAPVLFWSAMQIFALLISINQIQLWARMPHPTENYAMQIMLAMQIGFAAMLFPWLMRNGRSTAFIFLTSALFVQLAGMLGNETGGAIGWSIAQLWMWLIALATWRVMLVTSRMQMLGVAVATSLAIGGACVDYLQMEFTTGAISTNLINISLILLAVSGAIGIVFRGRAKLSTDC